MQLSAKIFAKVGSERITQYSLVNDHQMLAAAPATER